MENNRLMSADNSHLSINKGNTFIILDWDDTLFPTTWFVKNMNDINNFNSHKYIVYFAELDETLYKLLLRLISFGHVVIITNASLQWVSVTMNSLKKTNSLMNKLTIISARDRHQYETIDMSIWKIKAFENYITRNTHNMRLVNILSVGDAQYEYDALLHLAIVNTEQKKILKSIKLIDNPTQDNILEQLNILLKSIPIVCSSTKHLDLKFKKK